MVATLWVLAGLTVLAGYIHSVTTTSVERATVARVGLQRELDRRNTETTLIYLLATNRKSHRALILQPEQSFGEFDLPSADAPEVALAGETYAGLGDVLFAIQDESGLVPVNSPVYPMLRAALETVGVSRANATRLISRAKDYVDTDDLPTLNGGERYEYSRRGLPPPPNWLMATPMELEQVQGFSDLVTRDQWQRLRGMLTMRQATSPNFNTMPADIVRAVLDDQAAADILALRASGSVVRTLPYGGFADVMDDIELRMRVSDRLRIATWSPGTAQRVVGIQLTAYTDGSAWRKDYSYTAPRHQDPTGSPERPVVPETALLH
ncbi:MAG: type II secretion system protein GspK [Gammaproteobacteria bacterium]|nr:type II secretion system protein GspK [Gammaproteobacteria bacterium]